MKKERRLLLSAAAIALFAALAVTGAAAQKNEVAISFGGYIPINSPVGARNAFAIGGNVAHRIAHVPFVALYLEVPITGTLDAKIPLSQVAPLSSASYSSIFVTPGLKLKLAPVFPVSPYFAVGGGLAHFSSSVSGTSQSNNTGVFDVAAGLDMKIAPFLSARGEIRDYYSGTPNILTGFTNRQHQLFPSVGLVLRF